MVEMHRALRPVSYAVVTAVIAVGTAACGSSNDVAGGPGCDAVKPGSVSDSVKVTGDQGKEQTANIPSGLKATGVQRSVIIKGSGQKTKKGDDVDALFTVYTEGGKKLVSREFTITMGDSQIPLGFRAGVSCVPVGSRSVVTLPAKDIVGDQTDQQSGVGPNDSLIAITDVIGTKAGSAGSPSASPSALPKVGDWKTNTATVTFDSSGKPTVKLPGSTPDPNLELQVLQAGTGAVVKSGDQVTVDYQGTSWDSQTVFDQSYGKQPATFGTGQVVPGFGAALVGQKVGTRLIVNIPPQYAYGPAGSGAQLSGQTLVFVIEIKATAPAQ